PGPDTAALAAATLAAVGRLDPPPARVDDWTAAAGELGDVTAQRLHALHEAEADVVCFLTAGVVPPSTWLAALASYFANADVAAVGGPILPAPSTRLGDVTAAAVYESRFAAGPLSRRHVPGNLRDTVDASLANIAVRRRSAIASAAFEHAAMRRDDGN